MFKYNDGGRSNYFKGKKAGDCVTRAIAIATGKDYSDVYKEMAVGMGELGNSKSARNGVSKKVYHSYLLRNGFEWVPTMRPGSGCKVHLNNKELPEGILIARVSKHLCCMIDGVINDIYDPSRGGTRCVYGYYKKKY
jgi:hypothetical protein